MKLEKEFVYTINKINNPCLTIFENFGENLLNLVSEELERRCLGEYYIEKIIKITNIGRQRITKQANISSFSLDITFIANVTTYVVGELVFGAVILRKNPDNMYARGSAGDTELHINLRPNEGGIKIDNIITARVLSKSATSGKLSIAGEIYLPPQKFNVYRLRGNLPNFDHFAEEEAKLLEISKKNKDGWEKFSKLLHPFSEIAESKLPQFHIFKMPQNLDAGEFYYGFDSRQEFASPNVVRMTKGDANEYVEFVDVLATEAAFTKLAEEYLTRLKILNSMLATYDDKEKLASHTYLWQIYKQNKHKISIKK